MTKQVNSSPPSSFSELQSSIHARADGLPRRMQQIASYLLPHPDDVAFGNVASLSKSTQVASSAFVRFAQAFGFSGFSELQAVFQSEVSARAGVASFGHELGASIETGAFEQATKDQLASLKAAKAMRTEAQLQAAARLLFSARTIYIVAIGRAYAIGMLATTAFQQAGIRSLQAARVDADRRELLSLAEAGDALLELDIGTRSPKDRVEKVMVPHVIIADSVAGASRSRADCAILLNPDQYAVSTAIVVLNALAAEIAHSRSNR